MFVEKGSNAEKSVLYRILLPDPPSPFVRKPAGGPWFTSSQLKLI